MSVVLLIVDPSLTSTGVALFYGPASNFDGRYPLARAAKLRGAPAGADIVYRCETMARMVHQWAISDGAAPTEIVVEWPQIYQASKSKGDPNDLLGLAGICAAVAAHYPGAAIKSYTPAQWEPAPKVSPERKRRKLGPCDAEAFTSPRGLRIMSRLDEAERAAVPRSHDAVDAVGIGLHHLGRLAPTRVFPGAT